MARTRSQSLTLSKKEKEPKTKLKKTKLSNDITTTAAKTKGKIAKRKVTENSNSIITRSRSRTLLIKEEEEESKNNIKYSTTNNRNKRVKREPSENDNNDVSISQIKIEEESDCKTLLQAPQPKGEAFISQEQIQQIIKYIVNDKMKMRAVARKLNISLSTVYRYYNLYKNDPEQKIPKPQKRVIYTTKSATHQQIRALIRYIKREKMSVIEASKKVGICSSSGFKYYKRYKDDPEGKIFPPRKVIKSTNRQCTQGQIKILIHCIMDNKMKIAEAAIKANLSQATGRKYYKMYMNDPERKVPAPEKGNLGGAKRCARDKVNAFISFIVDNKMAVAEAARNANINQATAYKYYNRYKKDPKQLMSKPRKEKKITKKRCTQDQIKSLIDYIEKDKLTVAEASRKVNISTDTGNTYYNMYEDDPRRKIPEPMKSIYKYCTEDQIKELINCIVKNKMTILDASKKVNISPSTGFRYYHAYKNDPEQRIPEPRNRTTTPSMRCTQAQIKSLIHYTMKKKIPVKAASKKVNISESIAYKYISMYKNDPEKKIPKPSKQTKRGCKHYTRDQIIQLIDYIENKKFSITAAAIKVDMSTDSAARYYSRYVDDPNHNIPTPGKRGRQLTKKQIDQFIRYVFKDKMTIREASIKANMTEYSARRHYLIYLRNSKTQAK